MKALKWTGAAAALVIASAACGGDDDDNGGSTNTSGAGGESGGSESGGAGAVGGESTGGSAMGGGTTGGMGGDAMGGDGGMAGAPVIECMDDGGVAESTGCPAGADLVEVSDDIVADATWTEDKCYVLKDYVFVKGGATLTINPGTTVVGEEGSFGPPFVEPGTLIITADGKIDAVGTPQKPIVFTSGNAVGERTSGSWGGVVMLGTGYVNTNDGTDGIEGLPSSADGQYGGGSTPDDTHDCGKLKYARIEFAGFRIAMENELNGLSIGACGSDTEIDHVQVHRGADDGVEVFGGSVDLKHVVITGAADDSLDWDQGWDGRVQYLVINQGIEGDHGFETDGCADKVCTNLGADMRRSDVRVFNATVLGTSMGGDGLHFKEGTRGFFRNFVVAGFGEGVANVVDAPTADNLSDDSLTLMRSLLSGSGPTAAVSDRATPTPNQYLLEAHFTQTAFNNTTVADITSVLPGAFEANRPGCWVPAAGETAFTENAATPSEKMTSGGGGSAGAAGAAGAGSTGPTKGPFFDTAATYKGAFEPGQTPWTAGWVAFPEN